MGEIPELDPVVDHIRGPLEAHVIPLTDIHPHAWAAATAAEAAALQDYFWEMYDVLFPNQAHLEEGDLRRYAADLGLDLDRFESDRTSEAVRSRIEREG